MKKQKTIILTAAVLAGGVVWASPSAEEIKRLSDIEYAHAVRPGNPETGAPF